MENQELKKEMIEREFALRRIFARLTRDVLPEERPLDFTFVSNMQYNDIEKDKAEFSDIIINTEDGYIYVTIKSCNVEDVQELFKLHHESYMKLRERNIESLHLNLVYGNYEEDFTARRTNVDMGDSKYIFKIVDVNMDRLIENYENALGRITTEQELEILKELKSKYACTFEEQ